MDEELEAVAIESTHTIDIDSFVPRKEIDELYWNAPYYAAPDGEVGRQAFAVIREALHHSTSEFPPEGILLKIPCFRARSREFRC